MRPSILYQDVSSSGHSDSQVKLRCSSLLSMCVFKSGEFCKILKSIVQSVLAVLYCFNILSDWNGVYYKMQQNVHVCIKICQYGMDVVEFLGWSLNGILSGLQGAYKSNWRHLMISHLILVFCDTLNSCHNVCVLYFTDGHVKYLSDTYIVRQVLFIKSNFFQLICKSLLQSNYVL